MVGGWVAAGSKTGAPWLADDAASCPPTANLTFDELATLMSADALHRLPACLGRDGLAGQVAVDARARLECSGAPISGPSALADPPFTLLLSGLNGETPEVPMLGADGALALTCGAPATNTHYRVFAHFDDSEAGNCRSTSPATDVDPELANELAVLACRMRLVSDGGNVVAADPTPPPGP
jgi:hypothetical protein